MRQEKYKKKYSIISLHCDCSEEIVLRAVTKGHLDKLKIGPRCLKCTRSLPPECWRYDGISFGMNGMEALEAWKENNSEKKVPNAKDNPNK